MRKLILVRIVHDVEDMGSIRGFFKKIGEAKIGKEKWKEKQRMIEQFWIGVARAIDALGLDYSKVKIYQDGLPCGGDLGLRIVNESAAKGSANFQILTKLIERGAAIEATESAELLIKEYQHVQAIANAKTEDERIESLRQYRKVKDKLLEERDDAVARAIDATLREGETGILFIGAFHNVSPKLPNDIEIVRIS